MSKAKEEKAEGLVNDYKSRLSPYVNAMKDRGYFGEAMKLKVQQQNQGQIQNQESQQAQAKQADQASPQGQACPVRGGGKHRWDGEAGRPQR